MTVRGWVGGVEDALDEDFVAFLKGRSIFEVCLTCTCLQIGICDVARSSHRNSAAADVFGVSSNVNHQNGHTQKNKKYRKGKKRKINTRARVPDTHLYETPTQRACNRVC